MVLLLKELASERADPPVAGPAAQIRWPAESAGGLNPRSTHQGRQQQLQTRLKSTCRRATRTTTGWQVGRGAVTRAILRWRTPSLPIPISTRRDFRARKAKPRVWENRSHDRTGAARAPHD